MTALTDEDSIRICATFCKENESDTTQPPIVLREARSIHGNVANFRELLADKGHECSRSQEIVTEGSR